MCLRDSFFCFNPWKSFSSSALLTFGPDNSLLGWTELWVVGRWTASLASLHQTPVATPNLSCDNQRMSPEVARCPCVCMGWGGGWGDSPFTENLWSLRTRDCQPYLIGSVSPLTRCAESFPDSRAWPTRWTPPTSAILQNVFWWLAYSLSIMCSRFISILACIRISFLLKTE